MEKNSWVVTGIVAMALFSSIVVGRTLLQKPENRKETGFSSAWAAAGQDGMDSVSLSPFGEKAQDTVVRRLTEETSVSEDGWGQEKEHLLPEENDAFGNGQRADGISSDKQKAMAPENGKGSRGITPDRIFARFRHEPGAIHMRIPKFLLRMGEKAMAESGETDEEDKMSAELINSIDNLRILVLEDCSRKVQRDFIRMSSRMDLKGFEKILQVKDDEDKVDIWVKGNNGVIGEAVFVIGGDDCVLLHFKGEFREEDLGRLMEMKN